MKTKTLKRISVVFLAVLVMLSSMSLTALTTVRAEEDSAPAVTEETVEETVAEETEAATEPVYIEETQAVVDVPAEAETAPPVVEAASEETTAEEAVVTETEAASEETIIEETKATEEETEAKMPAAEFNGSANGVNVRVVADEGTFPEGTTMKVTAVNAAQLYDTVNAAIEGEAATIKAVDVTFYDADGKEIQPAIPVHMTMNAYGMDSSATKEVIHIDDNGNADVIKAAAINGNQAAFEATSFSVYIVVDEEDPSEDENAVATYKFYVGEELKSTQYIKTGDTLVDPGTLGAGDGSTSIFNGWYVSEGQTIEGETPGEKLAFGKKSPVPKTETIKIEAKVTTTYYVTFLGEKLNEERAISAVETVTVDGPAGTAGSLDISGFSVIPKQDTSAFKGWAEEDGGEVLTDSTITVSGPKTLYAVVVNANWIHFDENIADWDNCDSDPTYTGPVYVAKDDDLSTKKPADPTRKGYTFGGWYEDSECTTAFSWSGTGLEKDITLYAKWVPAATKYTVIIWKQKVTDAKDAAQSAKTYDFEASVVVDATTHDPLADIDLSEYKNLDYTGFKYAGDATITYTNASKEVENTVSANGDTVINIYYDRNLMTISFVSGSHTEYVEATDNNGTQYGLVDGEYVRLNRSGWNGNYTWSYQVTNSYSGTYYHQVNNNTGTQYGIVDGQLVQLTRQNGNWYYNGSPYYGDRYAEGEASGWSTTYGVVNGSLVALDEDWWTGEYSYTQTITYTDTRYKTATVPTTVEYTGLYGSTLASNGYTWPSEETWYQNPNSGGTRLTFLDAFKFEGLSGVSADGTTLTQYAGQAPGNNAVRFYKENIGGGYPSTATNTVYTGNNSTFTVTEKYEGFTAVRYSNNNGSGTISAGDQVSANGLRLYFERNNYSLTFMSDGSAVATKEDVPYEAVLSNYKIADLTEADKPHYEFKGWYEDVALQQPVDWNSTMPAANKVVYAKWEAKTYHVSLDANGGTLSGTQDAEFNVPLDTILDKDSLFQNVSYDANHELVGWFYKNEDDSAGNVYDYGKIEADVYLIAKWRMPGQVSIVYDADEGGSGAPTDNYKYATDSAVVLAAPPTTIKDGYIFVGWKLKDNKDNVLDTIYYPGNTFDITEDLIADYDPDTKTGTINVIAVYNKTNEGPFEKTYIRWFKNDGSECFHVDTLESPTGDIEDSTLLVNEMVDIQKVEERSGFEFLGWAKVDEAEDIALTQDLTEADLFIKYEDGVFKSVETGTVCTQVAADNDRQYQAMFAVWKQNAFTVIWMNGSTELEKDENHPGGTKPSYDGAVPTKTDTQYDYTFEGWADKDGQETGTPAADLPVVTEDVTYYAAFSKTEKEITINYVAGTGGSVNPESETVGVVTGEIAGSTATADEGYEFVNWTDESGAEVSKEATFVPTEKKAATYTANFKEKEVTITYEATTGGSVSPTSEKVKVVTGTPEGSTATADEGYEFVNWTDAAGEEVGTNAMFIPEENKEATYTANFKEKEVTITYVAGEGGSVSPESETVKVVTGKPEGSTATADDDYEFVNWTDESGAEVSTEATFVPEENKEATYTANFKEKEITITYVAEEGGSVSPTSEKVKVVTGTIQGSTATPKSGYSFGYWMDDQGWVSDDATFVPTEKKEATYRAVFIRQITITADDKSKTYGDADPELTYSVSPSDVSVEELDLPLFTLVREEGEDVGKYVISFEFEAVTKGAGGKKAAETMIVGDYEITFAEGTFTINPAVVTITTPSGTKVADGTALTAAPATITGLKNGETATVTATGSQTAVGSSQNGYSITWGTGKASNYTIKENLGTLTVTAAPDPIPDGPPDAPVIIPPAAPVVVPDEPTPQVEPPTQEPTTEEIIEPDPTPKTNTKTWALLNLILSAITVILAIVMIITFATGSKDDEDEENQDGENKKSRNGLKFLGLIPAIGTVVLFFLTEDLTAKMALTDKWTILTAVITVIGIVLTIVIKNKKKNNEEETPEA